jgi:hypothetical protein
MAEARQGSGEATAVLLERGGSFFVYEPNLGIIASDGTVEGAYRRFTGARLALAEEAERAGLTLRRSFVPARLPLRPAQAVPGGHRSVVAELSLFVAKLGIFLLIVGGIGLVVAATVGSGGKPLGMADVADKAAEIARDVSSLPPEKKELLRQSVGVVSRELGPVFDAWRNPPSQ